MDSKELIVRVLGDKVESYSRVQGGKDSTVWKVSCSDNKQYALRVLPVNRHHQFVQEKYVMQLAADHGIPVPKIHQVECIESFTIMLADWLPGRTVFEEILSNPGQVDTIGYEFGKVHARIHAIKGFDVSWRDWFTAENETEQELKMQIATSMPTHDVLLHLDYHPLNVTTDGTNITGVIDWINASTGDFRYDVARTLSILRTEAPKLIEATTLEVFEEAWRSGYESVNGEIGDVDLFLKWADVRMERDNLERDA
ncbi:phosphotransferase family protein [Ornithinibacillus salinisoli]|uniref:Phosphotransferase family protein n=1 Tax=Ornithinibacillus salinisoli TaxID=1848459 RepID=A0ABW4VUV2_9BACI